MKYRHVIWDWNGTLFDDAWLCLEILNNIRGRRGMSIVTPNQYQEVFDFPVKDYYAKVGFDFSVEPFEALAAEFVAEYEARRHECSLQTNARAILSAISGLSLSQSVLSAYEHARLEELLSVYGLHDYFTDFVGLDDHYAASKLDNGRRVVEDLGIPASEVLLIGDTTHDHEVADAVGAHCVLIPCGHQSARKLLTCGVPVLDSLSDVLRFIERSA